MARRALIALALAACRDGGTIVHERLAVGWDGGVPDFLLGPHDCAWSEFRADRAGKVEISCRDGHVEVEVVPVAQLVLVVPPALPVDSFGEANLVARDAAGGELALGDRAQVGWTVSPPLVRRDDTCKHQDSDVLCRSLASWAASPSHIAFTASTRGRTTIEARWHELRATAAVEVQ